MKKLRRRGQIFLILTILVVSFMVGITSVLLDVQRADFVEPAPDAKETLRAWEIAVESLEQILDIHLSENSRGITVTPINESIDRLSSYLSNRGISNEITNETNPTYSNVTVGNSNFQTVSSTFYIFLASSSTTIEQSIDIVVEYRAEVASGLVTISKSISGETTFLAGVSDDAGGNIDDVGNGSYNYVGPGEVINFITISQVLISITALP